MKWIERLNDCVDYIEENIHDEISIDNLCNITYLSRTYLFLTFEAVTNMTLYEYIRKRRMTLAASDIINGDKVIEVAFNYGYQSSEAFSRAFKNVHGVSPTHIKTKESSIKFYGKLTFKISIKGDVHMNYKIVDKETFQVLGASIITKNIDGEDNKDIPKFWEDIRHDGRMEKMWDLGTKDEMYGICWDIENSDSYRYIAGVPYNNGEKADFEVFDLPETKWAIFEVIGPMPDAIQKVWQRIFSEWLPSTGYELAHLPSIEYYYPGNAASEDYKSEVWIPIK